MLLLICRAHVPSQRLKIWNSRHTEKPERLETYRHNNKTTSYREWHNPRTSPLCVSYQVGHTAGESLISPAAIDKTNKLLGESAANKLWPDIQSRIRCMSSDIKQLSHIPQLHECTDQTLQSTGHQWSMCVVKWDSAGLWSIKTVRTEGLKAFCTMWH